MSKKIPETDSKSDKGGHTNWAGFDALTEEEVMAAALADPDAQPLPEGATLRRMVRSKWLRIKIGQSQEHFADRYHIPLATLVAWERREAEPDAIALAFMDAIAADPEGVANALAKSGQPAQAAE